MGNKAQGMNWHIMRQKHKFFIELGQSNCFYTFFILSGKKSVRGFPETGRSCRLYREIQTTNEIHWFYKAILSTLNNFALHWRCLKY
jgi:hypothetical protein